MKIVNTGNVYRIYGDDLKTYDSLPAKAYIVQFHPLSGFYLEEYPLVEVTEKIYGPHMQKADKVLNAYKRFDRNLGVILSGNKGIGKSITAKLIAHKALKENLPVIIINTYINGIADYLTSINQECLFMFDEFDKTFAASANVRNNDDNSGPQSTLLTLFDGLCGGKKLFVVTCNDLSRLNDYLVNRPGRFHYHFRFDYPSKDEIVEYMKDKLKPEYYGEINKVTNFATKVDINYDCLRAIAFEINYGATFEDAIKDLNIINVDEYCYKVYAILNDGSKTTQYRLRLDLFNNSTERIWVEAYKDCDIEIRFNPADSYYNNTLFNRVIDADKLRVNYREIFGAILYNNNNDGDREESLTEVETVGGDAPDTGIVIEEYTEQEKEVLKKKGVKYLVLEREYDKSIHYAF
jgi:hypothetical protein